MVHLSPDSRLLVSLVKQEQAYAAQLHNLLGASGSSLSALAVYASSSPPAVSPILNGVASALAGADEALRDYGEALNNWIDQLRTIKLKEEEVANVGRDREILVTRLLKASQKSKSPPPSLRHAPDSSSSSFHTFSSKVTSAQTELQACESHLAEKERELERVRIHAIKQGLELRCRALVQCGWAWGEMGRRAISMLEELDHAPSLGNGHATEFFKPLPNPLHDHDRDSALSSLSPSQSASQIGAISHSMSPLSLARSYRLDIPPPHLTSEHSGIPGSSIHPSTHAAQSPEKPDSSSEDEGPVEVYENPRFQPEATLSRRRSVRTAPSSPARGSPVPFPSQSKSSSDIGPSITTAKAKHGRDRKSPGIFGNIASLFRTSMNSKPPGGGQWNTRTSLNIKGIKTDGEESSEEESRPRGGRLRKGKGRATTVDENKRGPVNAPLLGAGAAPLSMPSPPAPSTRARKKSAGERDGSDTVRSTKSESASAPRIRANTLNGSPLGPTLVQGQDIGSHRASVDSRRGLAGTGFLSGVPLDTSGYTPVPKSLRQTKVAKGDSLMSMMEGVSHSRSASQSQNHENPSSRLEVVRAPGSHVSGLPLLVHPPPPLSASAPASLALAPSVAIKRSSLPVPATVALSETERKPLRSAMRNPDRDRSISPSPSRSANTNTTDLEHLSLPMSPLSLPGPASPSQRPSSTPRPGIPSTIIESPRHSMVDTSTSKKADPGRSPTSAKTDDSVSISSYETGHENFDVEPAIEAPSAPVPPPASEKVAPTLTSTQTKLNHLILNGIAHTNMLDKHELSSATSTDTATGSQPNRRKSVRMSLLPPQISATPPALEDYEDEDRSPWGKKPKMNASIPDEGWKTRTPTSNLAWDDSSSEDEEYKAARTALSRMDRGSEKKRR